MQDLQSTPRFRRGKVRLLSRYGLRNTREALAQPLEELDELQSLQSQGRAFGRNATHHGHIGVMTYANGEYGKLSFRL